MEPYWATLQGATEGRYILTFANVGAEPARGCIYGIRHGLFGAYLWSRGLIDDRNFIAEQGHFMAVPSGPVQVLGPQRGIQVSAWPVMATC